MPKKREALEQDAFTFKLPQETGKAIRDYAKKHGISLAEVFRRLSKKLDEL